MHKIQTNLHVIAATLLIGTLLEIKLCPQRDGKADWLLT